MQSFVFLLPNSYRGKEKDGLNWVTKKSQQVCDKISKACNC